MGALTVLLLLIMVLEPGVLMVTTLMLVVNGPVPGMALMLLTMPPSVTTVSDTPVLMETTHLPFLSVITDMAPTVLGELPPTVLMTGPLLVSLPSTLLPFPDGPE